MIGLWLWLAWIVAYCHGTAATLDLSGWAPLCRVVEWR